METKIRLIFLLSLIISFPAFSHEGASHEGIPWPPEPQGITNVIVHSDVAQQSARLSVASNRIDVLEQKAISNSRAKRALGNKFTRITQIDKVDKKTGKVVNQVVFFSHDNHATVEVDFANENIQAIKSIPAREYQPEITDEEAAQAEALARTHFLNKGIAKVSDLKAYSILTYKPDSTGFYDNRVIYVSFHDNDDAPPELMAWVDLTRQRIIKAREEE